MGKHLEQALPSVYTLQCLTGKVDNNNNNINDCGIAYLVHVIMKTRRCVSSRWRYIPTQLMAILY